MSERNAVVTGAAGGMGRAICEVLVEQGMRVVGLDRDAAGLQELLEQDWTHKLSTIAIDLTDQAAIVAAFEQIRADTGGTDVLVNNAGTCLMGEFPSIDPEEVEAQMAINFHAAFHCCQAAIPQMLARPGFGKIVNLSSNGAYNFDVFDPPHYRASKAALDTLTKDLARRYAKQKICVNSIAPAMTETPLFNVVSEEVLAKAIAAMPHGEPMQPRQIAQWVGFLASSAGDICSGNVIILNQGRDVR